MKKIITLSILCFTIMVSAQGEDSKDQLLEDVTKDTCECIAEKNKEGISPEDLEMQLGLCLINSYGKFKKRIDKHLDVSLNNPESLEKFGQEVGLKMLTVCPDTFMSFAGELIEEEMNNDSDGDYVIQKESSNLKVVSGNVVNLKKDQFNIINFKATNKRMYKLLWMEYFEGQELLGELRKLKNKELKVSYENKEMYDPELKDYRMYKVVRKIEVVN